MGVRRMSILLCLMLSIGSLAQDAKDERRTRHKPADASELAAITTRGRALSAYDELAWHATDAVVATHPPDAEVGMYVGVQGSAGLVMGFGHLNPDHTSFQLACETVPMSSAQKPEVLHHAPAIEETGDWLHEALAVSTVTPLIKGEAKIYNTAVLPAGGGRWYVYAYPAQTENGVYPTGSDVRYLVSADGLRVEETHRMHYSLLQWTVPKDAKTMETYRTAVLDDAPEDTDVAIVLMMGGIPSRVLTRKYVYLSDGTGQIKYVTTTEVFMKKAK